MAVVPTLGLFLDERFGLRGEELEWWTGWAYAAAPLTAAILGPVWGALGDRIGRKPMVLRASLAIGVTNLLMVQANSPGMLVLLRVLQGAFAGYIAPAMALATQAVAVEKQGRTIGRLQVALAMGLLVGPGVGAHLASAFDRATVFYFSGAMSLLASVPVLLLVREEPLDPAATTGSGGGRPSLLAGLSADIWGLLRNRIFLSLLGCVFLLRFGQQMVEPYVALWVRELGGLPFLARLGSEPGWAGSLGSERQVVEWSVALSFHVLAIAQLLFAARWGVIADRFGPLRCLAVVGLGLGAVFWVTASVRSPGAYLGMRCLAALFMSGGMTLAYTAVSGRVAQGHRALAFAFVQSGMQFGLALGPVCGPSLAWEPGTPGLYRVGALSLLVAGLGMLVLRRISRPRAALAA